MADKTVRLGNILLIIMVVAFLMMGGCCGGCAALSSVGYSDGERTGTISKFSNKGIFWKTWEGEMVLGGFKNNGDNGVVSNTWDFSITDPAVIAQVQEAQRTGGTVTLHYKQVLGFAPWKGSTSYYVTSVSPTTK